jgi:hypothetical protein
MIIWIRLLMVQLMQPPLAADTPEHEFSTQRVFLFFYAMTFIFEGLAYIYFTPHLDLKWGIPFSGSSVYSWTKTQQTSAVYGKTL